MTDNQFIRLPAEQPMGPKYEYEATINKNFINYAVPSNAGQVGKTILMLARGPERSNTVAAMENIDTLANKMPHLTRVEVYSSGMGKVTGPGLVNLSRVVQITEYEKFRSLAFVDGEEINVTNTLF